MKYQKPVVNSESFECIHAVGQYIFEFIPSACPGMNGTVGQEAGYAVCTGLPIGGPFSVEVTCENIAGTYNIVVGTPVLGGGLECGSGDSLFFPISSVNPELPADCIVNSFVFDGSFDECQTS